MKAVVMLALGVLAGGLVGCATDDTRPSAAVATLLPGADRWFTLDWSPQPERDGERRLQGHILSALGEAATKVQLLALALDASGTVIARRVQWLPETILSGDRVYFEIPNMPPAAEYRVSVWAFERIKGGGGA